MDTRGSLRLVNIACYNNVLTLYHHRVWEPSPSSIVTKARADYINTVLSMDWVHVGGSDSLVKDSIIF